jgi:archaellum component FlaG (FlaF/FlaG flagellin family)
VKRSTEGAVPHEPKPTTINLERAGMRVLVAHLKKHGRSCSPSDVKRYDLIVDGRYCELKATTQPFFGLSENQYAGLQSGELATVFVVNGDSVTEYSHEQLLAVEPKPETTYYFYRSQIR